MKPFVYCALASLSLITSCGNGSSVASSAPEDGPFELRCQEFCDMDEAPGCNTADQELCLARCRSRTAGLTLTCGACLLDEGYEPYGSDSCELGRISEISDPNCNNFCADTEHPGGDTEIALHCEDFCRGDEAPGCGDSDLADCYDSCIAKTSGLTVDCATCLLDEGYEPYGSDSCELGRISEISDPNCTDFCA